LLQTKSFFDLFPRPDIRWIRFESPQPGFNSSDGRQIRCFKHLPMNGNFVVAQRVMEPTLVGAAKATNEIERVRDLFFIDSSVLGIYFQTEVIENAINCNLR